jgi:hypothetical protein
VQAHHAPAVHLSAPTRNRRGLVYYRPGGRRRARFLLNSDCTDRRPAT